MVIWINLLTKNCENLAKALRFKDYGLSNSLKYVILEIHLCLALKSIRE